MEKLINELKELKENYEIGMNTENEFFNQSVDVILRNVATPDKNRNFIVDMEKFLPLIDKIIQ